MSAPRMHPSGIVNVTSTATMEGKLQVFGYGADDRIPNPGDLLIVTTNWIRENMKTQEIEFSLKIRGRDMLLFVNAAKEALGLWDDNKHWLSKSMSDPGVDMRSLSGIRGQDQRDSISKYMEQRNRI